MGIDPAIDITEEDHKAVLDLLRRHLPDTTAWVYGSRAKWTSRPQSDLDLVVFATPEQRRQVGDLREAFEESNLPFRVDLFVWDDVPVSFRERIKQDHVVLTDQLVGVNAGPPPSSLYHPPFPSHWKRVPLYSTARWVNGLAFRNIAFSATGRPVIKIAEIKGGISSQTKFTHQTFDDSVRVRPGDLLFSWSGQPETSIDAFWWHGPEGWLNQHVFRITPNAGIDVTFFFYILRYLKPNFVSIARNKQTTGLGHVTKRDLESIEVALPELNEQRAIAHVLGTLDDKIELNRRMNMTLAAMARAIFKDWFVDFGPTRAKAEGRASYLPPETWDLFSDRLVGSHLDEIPAGWNEVGLKQLGKVITGKTPSTRKLEYFGDEMPFLKIPDMRRKLYVLRTSTSLSIEGAKSQSRKTLPTGSISVSCIATPGLVVLNHQEVQTNQQINSLVPSSPEQSIFIFWSCRQLASDVRRGGSGGSVLHNMNKTSFENLPIIFPGNLLARLFSTSVSSFHDRILANEYESENLARIRDWFLSEIISGKIDTVEIEKARRPGSDGRGEEDDLQSKRRPQANRSQICTHKG